MHQNCNLWIFLGAELSFNSGSMLLQFLFIHFFLVYIERNHFHRSSFVFLYSICIHTFEWHFRNHRFGFSLALLSLLSSHLLQCIYVEIYYMLCAYFMYLECTINTNNNNEKTKEKKKKEKKNTWGKIKISQWYF